MREVNADGLQPKTAVFVVTEVTKLVEVAVDVLVEVVSSVMLNNCARALNCGFATLALQMDSMSLMMTSARPSVLWIDEASCTSELGVACAASGFMSTALGAAVAVILRTSR